METLAEKVDNKSVAPQAGLRKNYEKPRLEAIGDVRSLTLGGSVGSGESGGKWPLGHGKQYKG
jgi:hypothetical protein